MHKRRRCLLNNRHRSSRSQSLPRNPIPLRPALAAAAASVVEAASVQEDPLRLHRRLHRRLHQRLRRQPLPPLLRLHHLT